MAGARFVRADLHVHLSPDGDEPTEAAEDYIRAAIDKQIEVLGITDHNTVANVRPAMQAAEGTGVLVVPGVEVSSTDGHLLTFFPPDNHDALESFATAQNLGLGPRLPDGSRRSNRTMRSLLDEVGRSGGFGIAAHVDANDGIQANMGRGALIELLCHPALAGLEAAPVTAGGLAYPFDMSRSWLISSAGVNTGLVRSIGIVVMVVTFTAFTFAALATAGWLVPAGWWPSLVLGAAAASTLMVVLFFSPALLLGFAINAALAWLVLASVWSPLASRAGPA